MKLFIALLFVFAFVALSATEEQHHPPLPSWPSPPYPRGCIYVNGRCYRECEVGTHAYTTGCGQKTPEATCDQPNPVKEEGAICDYTACYCDAPTVRDKASGKCVTLEECPKKENLLV